MEKIAYFVMVYVMLSLLAAYLIPFFYAKTRRRKKRKGMSKFNRQVIVGAFTYVLGLLAIASTPVLIPFVEQITKGDQNYPWYATAIVAVLMVAYAAIMYVIMTFMTRTIVRRMSRNSSGR